LLIKGLADTSTTLEECEIKMQWNVCIPKSQN